MNGGAGYQKTGIWLILAWIFLPVETAYRCPAPKKVVAKKAVKSLPTATIKAAQQALSKDGLYKGKIDGMIGPMTTNAVKAFQKKEGLKVDGIIGPKTLKALGVK